MTPTPFVFLGLAAFCAKLAMMGEAGGAVVLWIACAACLVRGLSGIVRRKRGL